MTQEESLEKSPQFRRGAGPLTRNVSDSATADAIRLDSGAVPHRELPSRRSLRFMIAVGLVLLQVVTVAGILVSQRLNEQRALRTHMMRIMDGIIVEIQENAQGFLLPAQNVTALSKRLFQSGLLDWTRKDDLERYFFGQLGVVPQIDAVYFADLQGQYLMVQRDDGGDSAGYRVKTIEIQDRVRRVHNKRLDASRRVVAYVEDAEDAYDPRLRPWYKNALATKELVWTDPYVFFSSQQPGITSATPVYDNRGSVSGVIGVDIRIGLLSEFLTRQNVGDAGSSLIINRQGDYIAHSHFDRIGRGGDDMQSNALTLEDIVDPIERAALSVFEDPSELLNFAWLRAQDKMQHSFAVDGRQFHTIFKPFPKQSPWPWVIGVYAAESDFIGPIQRGERNKMIGAIVVSAGITLVAFFLARRYMQPVVALRDEVDRDVLTGIHNRRSLFETAKRLMEVARRKGAALSVIVVDIDQFKNFNDSYGHTVGDQVLLAVVKRLQAAIIGDDLLARYAGDEFVLLLPGAPMQVARNVAERLRTTISASPIKTTAGEIAVTVSLGVAELTPEIEDFEKLFDGADHALRFAKAEGRNRVMTATDLFTAEDAMPIARSVQTQA